MRAKLSCSVNTRVVRACMVGVVRLITRSRSIIRENHVHVPLNPFAHVRTAILCFAQANVIMYRCDILLHVHAYRYIINWTTTAVTTTSL